MSKANTKAIIDANIKQNGNQEITGQILNSVLNTMVTDYAEQTALNNLNAKVDSLALGAFYGYFPDSDSLPTDAVTKGYAYVGEDNPYAIWNFNGEEWSNSGTSIDMNDADEEDITRNADGKLQFKNRDNTDGMGYVILRKDKTFAEQVTEENTIYEIRYDFNLGGNYTMPNNSILKFKGGKIGGSYTLTGNNTKIHADVEQIFDNNINISGTWNLGVAFPEWFGAIADGETDCTNAIMNCLKFKTNSNIGVQFTGKEYIVDGVINLSSKNNITFFSQSNSKIIKPADNDTNLFYGDYPTNITFNGLYLEGNRKSTLDWQWPNKMNAGILLRSGNNIRLINSTIKDFWYGVCLASSGNSYNAWIDGCYFLNNNSDIDMYGKPAIFISNNTLKGCTENSIQLEPVYKIDPTIQDYRDQPNYDAIDVSTFIVNNSISECKGYAIIVHNSSTEIQIRGNNIINYYGGIFVKDECYNVIIDGNILKNSMSILGGSARPTSEPCGIIADGINVKCINNIIDHASNGISVYSKGVMEVAYNLITNTRHTGMILGGLDSDQITIESNTIRNTFLDDVGWWGNCAIYVSGGVDNVRFINNKLIQTLTASAKKYHAVYFNISNAHPVFIGGEISGYSKYFEGSGNQAQWLKRYTTDILPISGTTRPTTNLVKGFVFFDESLAKPIWWTGTKWVDATGADV